MLLSLIVRRVSWADYDVVCVSKRNTIICFASLGELICMQSAVFVLPVGLVSLKGSLLMMMLDCTSPSKHQQLTSHTHTEQVR